MLPPSSIHERCHIQRCCFKTSWVECRSFFFFQAEDGIRDLTVTGVQTCALPICPGRPPQLFRPVRGMDPTGPRRYQLMAEILADQLAAGPDPAAHAIQAGRAWAEIGRASCRERV